MKAEDGGKLLLRKIKSRYSYQASSYVDTKIVLTMAYIARLNWWAGNYHAAESLNRASDCSIRAQIFSGIKVGWTCRCPYT